MDFKTNSLVSIPIEQQKLASYYASQNQIVTKQLLENLPTHRDLLKKIFQFGLSSI
jgi:tryptophan 7-halogenase